MQILNIILCFKSEKFASLDKKMKQTEAFPAVCILQVSFVCLFF